MFEAGLEAYEFLLLRCCRLVEICTRGNAVAGTHGGR